MTSKRRAGCLAVAEEGIGLPLLSRGLTSLARCRLSLRLGSSSGSSGLPFRSTTDDSEFRLGRDSRGLLS